MRGRIVGLEQHRPQGRDSSDSFSLWAPGRGGPSLKEPRLLLPRLETVGWAWQWMGLVLLLRVLSLLGSRYNVEVKHIKIMTSEGLYRITEKKAFRGLLVRADVSLTQTSQDLVSTLPALPSWDPHFPHSEWLFHWHYGTVDLNLLSK
jgi:hypothetical protein